jgi:hypothetical protein
MSARLGATLLLCLPIGFAQAAADPTGFTCKFAAGTAHAYDKGQFVPEMPAPLTFSISAINSGAQSAELRSERGTGTLRLVQAVNALRQGRGDRQIPRRAFAALGHPGPAGYYAISGLLRGEGLGPARA